MARSRVWWAGPPLSALVTRARVGLADTVQGVVGWAPAERAANASRLAPAQQGIMGGDCC
jgi:hypothetical protein